MFFNQAGKKKKKKETSHMRESETKETKLSSSEENKQEKIMFLSPEEQYISKIKDGHGAGEEQEEVDDSVEGIIQGDPIIINGADYLLHINETRMEALLTLYRRFSEEELHGILKENGIIFGVRKKTLEELAQGIRIMRKQQLHPGLPPKMDVTVFLNIILIHGLQ